MALSPLGSKAFPINGRSLSLPSKLQNPAISEFSESLSKIASSSSVESTLGGLKILYCYVDDLLMLPHTQQTISKQRHEKWVNDRVLDAYIRLLDACTSATDIVSQMKHDVQELLSSLRRKDANGIRSYQASRKSSRRAIRKALKELRISFRSTKRKEQQNSTLAVLCTMIKEAESVTITTFELLLSYMVMDKEAVPERQSGWLSSVWKRSTEVEIDSSRLKEMDSSIRLVENELEGLSKQLIKTRVSLLNILNH